METVQKDIKALKIAEVTSIIDDGRLAIVMHAGSMEEKKLLSKR